MDKKLEIGLKILEAMDSSNLILLDSIFRDGERSVMEITPKENWTWLHKALLGFDSDKPSSDVINYLIGKGIDINSQDMYGMTALHYALRSKNIEAAITLLKAGANPNLPDERGITPLSYINGFPERLDLLQLMLDNGGDVDFFTEVCLPFLTSWLNVGIEFTSFQN